MSLRLRPRKGLFDPGDEVQSRDFELPRTLLTPLIAALDRRSACLAGFHILNCDYAAVSFVAAVQEYKRDVGTVGMLYLLGDRALRSEIELGRNAGAPKLVGHLQVLVDQGVVDHRHQHLRGGRCRAGSLQLDQRGEQAVYADRRTGRRHGFAEEALDQVVVTAAAEDGAELRGIEQNRFEDRFGVIGESARHAEIDGRTVLLVTQRGEVSGDAGELVNRAVRAGHAVEEGG